MKNRSWENLLRFFLGSDFVQHREDGCGVSDEEKGERKNESCVMDVKFMRWNGYFTGGYCVKHEKLSSRVYLIIFQG